MKNKRMLMILVAVLVMALIAAGIVLAGDVILDSFDEGEQSLTSTASADYNTVTGSGMLGGERDVYLERESGSNTARVEIDTGDDNTFAFSAGAGNQTIAQVVWDGTDGNATTIDYDGLGGSTVDGDLLDGTNDGVVIEVVNWDGNDTDLIFTVYEYQGANSSDYCSEATIELRGGNIDASSSETYALSFDDNFTQCSGASNPVSNFDEAGAVVLTIDSVTAGPDLVLDLTITSLTRDYGDLPSAYGITTEANDGARHVKSATYFGSSIDQEADGNPSTGADGDGVDEDGVTRPATKWTNGTDGGHVEFEVSSPMYDESACVDGWIDWNDDNDFDDLGEHVIDSLNLYYGRNSNNWAQTFDVPSGTFDDSTSKSFYTRWRLSPDTDDDGDCGNEVNVSYDGYVVGGEVEDYLWDFGPNAITLAGINAGPALAGLPAFALVVAAVVGGTGLFLWKRRA